MSARDSWRRFGSGPGGGGEVLALAYPLILSQMSFTVQVFVDRLFLTCMAAVLLRFVALYSIFDTMNVMFASGLRGAGDTAYPLMASVALSWALMLGPSWVLCVLGGAGIYTAWATATASIVALGLLMLTRFRAGRWRSLRVIEPRVASLEEEPAAV